MPRIVLAPLCAPSQRLLFFLQHLERRIILFLQPRPLTPLLRVRLDGLL